MSTSTDLQAPSASTDPAPERYRLQQLLQALGVRSEHTLAAWELSCPYLDGDPLASEKTPVQVTQGNQWGAFERTYRVRTWGAADVTRVQARQAAVQQGRYTDSRQQTWIREDRAIERLRSVPTLEKFPAGLLLKWSREKAPGCPHLEYRRLTRGLPGFLECPKAVWFLESETEELAGLLARAVQGVYGHGPALCMIPAKIREVYGWAYTQLRRWERWCTWLPREKLEPVFFEGGLHNKGGQTRTYRIADLEEITRNEGTPFDGIYQEGRCRRFSLTAAARLSGIPRKTLEAQEKRTKYLPEGSLETQPRRPRRPHSRTEKTITEEDLNLLVHGMSALPREPLPPGDWRAGREIAEAFNITTRTERVRLTLLLQFLRGNEQIPCEERVRPIASRQKRRSMFFYDVNAFKRWLGDEDLSSVLRRFNPSENERGEGTDAVSEADLSSPADGETGARRLDGAGLPGDRDLSPQPAASDVGCDVRAPRGPGGTGGRPLTDIRDEARGYVHKRYVQGDKITLIRLGCAVEYGESNAPKRDGHVAQDAKRYARKHRLPDPVEARENVIKSRGPQTSTN